MKIHALEPDRNMKIKIKDLNIASMRIESKGVELDISNDKGGRLGDLVITDTEIIWCEGKTTPEHGGSINWGEFLKYMGKQSTR
jgi:hypothetical protein